MPRQRKRKKLSSVEDLLREAETAAEPERPPFDNTESKSTQRRPHRLIPAIPPLTPASQWMNDPIKIQDQN
jgi:hypothetical protein